MVSLWSRLLLFLTILTIGNTDTNDIADDLNISDIATITKPDTPAVVGGVAGEFYRYKHQTAYEKPTDDNRIVSLRMASDIKCRACEVLVESLVNKTNSKSEDRIMDQFDGDLKEKPVSTGNEQVDRVNKHRRACNKHFKDELMLKGWTVRKCEETLERQGESSHLNKSWCLAKSEVPLTQFQVDTYSIHNDALFYACEQTVATHGHEIAAIITEKLTDGLPLFKASHIACLEAADCEGELVRKRRGERKTKMEKRKRRKTGVALPEL